MSRPVALTRYGASRDDVGAALVGEPRYRVDQVWQGLYTQLLAPEEMTALPKALRARVEAELPLALHQEVRRVSDDGDPNPRRAAAGGYGIVGMVERADLLGGTCEAGPADGRGWVVRARLPREAVPT